MDKESATKNERQNERARGPAARPARQTELLNGEGKLMTEEFKNVTRIHIGDKEIILVGTAQLSKTSAEMVKKVIETERPTPSALNWTSKDTGRSWIKINGKRWTFLK